MRSPAGGFFATVLMFVPLVAVPLLAVFGIPHFAPVVASSGDDTSDFELKVDPEIREAGVGESARYTPDDLFAPVSKKDRTSEANSNIDSARIQRPYGFPNRGRSDTGSTSRDAAERQTEPWPNDAHSAPRDVESDAPAWFAEAPPRHANPGDSTAGVHNDDPEAGRSSLSSYNRPQDSPFRDGGRRVSSSGSEAPVRPLFQDLEETEFATAGVSGDEFEGDASPFREAPATNSSRLTWREAVRKLNALGIRHYQLEPGARATEFQFSCFYTPANNPRITHRFEAEAGDPLEAVEKVISQIEQWLVAGR